MRPILVHVITGLRMGGAEMCLLNLVRHSQDSAFKHVVVSLMDEGVLGPDLRAAGVDVHSLGLGALPWRMPLALATLRKLVLHLQPAVFHGWMYHGYIAATFAQQRWAPKAGLVWGVHHTPDESLSREKFGTRQMIQLGARWSQQADRILYVAQVSRDVHEKLNYEATAGLVLPNGYDLARFQPQPLAKEDLRRELGLPLYSRLVLAAGRDHPMKDFATYVRAAALAAQQLPNVHFLLAGHGHEPGHAMLTPLIQELGLASRFHLLGLRRDMQRLLAACDLFTTSSAWGEAFPIVVGEGMACGTPAVVTNVGDSSLLVGNRQQVVSPGNPVELSAAWLRILALDEERYQTCSKASRDRIQELFSVESMAKRHEEIYQSAWKHSG